MTTRKCFGALAMVAALLIGSYGSAGDVPRPDPIIPRIDPKPKSDGAKSDPKKSKRVIRVPQVLTPPAPKPVDPPAPAPEPNATIRVGKGQYYVVGSNTPLVAVVNGGLKLAGSGDVLVQVRKPPLMLPAELAVGYKGDENDPEFVTFTEQYLYVIRPKPDGADGPVLVQLIPAVNELDAEAIQIPLTTADITYHQLDIRAGGKIEPAPLPKPKPDPKPDPKPEPTPADPELTKKFKDAINLDLAVKGTSAKREHVKALAGVYTNTAMVVTFPDPAARPKTWKDVQQGMVTASRLAGVPPPPEFGYLREAIEAEGGAFEAKTPVDKAFGEKLNASYNKIAAALLESVK